MNPLDLTHAPLFEDLLTLSFGPDAAAEDLHAAYTCRVCVDDGDGMAFLCRRADGAEVSLTFAAAVLLQSAGRFTSGAVLVAFTRGQYAGVETAGKLVEQYGGRYFYHLDFVDEDLSVTLAAAQVTAQFTPAP